MPDSVNKLTRWSEAPGADFQPDPSLDKRVLIVLSFSTTTFTTPRPGNQVLHVAAQVQAREL